MFVVQLKLPADSVLPVDALLELIEHSIVQRSDCETGETWLEMFFSSPDEAEEESRNLLSILDMLGYGDIDPPTVDEVPDRQWQDAWKEHFHSMQVSPRITVAPSWEGVDEAPGTVVVRLDPGMSFGTGQHATTQACLAFLDGLSTDGQTRSLCDVGCGSGILSIAGARLGYSPVLAFDNDPVSVRVASENLAVNGVWDVDVCHVDLADHQEGEPRQFDVVVANMLANLLEEFAPAIVARLGPGEDARLILAGMMGEAQYAWVRVVYDALELRELDARRDGDWVSLVLGR